MKEWMIGIGCVLSAGGWCEISPHQGDRYERMAIEREIQALKEYQDHLHASWLNEEVNAQAMMILDWERYGRDLEKIHQQKEEEKQINKRIQELEERKLALINSG